MTIAQLPPQNHINSLRSFISRIRRTRTIPSQQEFAHAEEALSALEAALRLPKASETASMPTSDDIIKQREEW